MTVSVPSRGNEKGYNKLVSSWDLCWEGYHIQGGVFFLSSPGSDLDYFYVPFFPLTASFPPQGLPGKAREWQGGLPQPQLPSRATLCHPLTLLCGRSHECHTGNHRVKLKQDTPQALLLSATAKPGCMSLDEPRDPLLPGLYKICSLFLIMAKIILTGICIKKIPLSNYHNSEQVNRSYEGSNFFIRP